MYIVTLVAFKTCSIPPGSGEQNWRAGLHSALKLLPEGSTPSEAGCVCNPISHRGAVLGGL